MRKLMPSAGRSHSKALTQRLLRSSGTSSLDRELAGLLDLELQVHRQRRGQHVVARAEVGRGGGDADQATALRHFTVSI
jgi:hypothetical protein